MHSPLPRSSSLNNIPLRKLQERQQNIVRGCEICAQSNTGEADGLCEKCSTKIVACNRFAEANIPLGYWNLKMERDFKGDPRLLAKYNELVADIRKVFTNGISVCFAGPHGVGKTLVATAVLKTAALKGFTCLYTTLSDTVNVLTSAPIDDRFTARKELTTVDFLVIDEFDPRFIATDNAADLYARTLETIFRTRAQNQLPTLMCSNSPNVIESFSGPLHDSISSLMQRYIEFFPVLGSDFRKQS
jgi:DNA replication protein DnaC